jgi:outer membrane receptor protein involved in Fe transport
MQPAMAGDAGSPNDIDTITVTAEKSTQRLIDVPASVGVVTADTLAQQNDTQLRDYFAQVPGLQVSSQGGGRTTVAIRGITTGSGNNPTVGFTIDDVPVGSSTGGGLGDTVVPDLDPSILDQIEVLRGPQGTLYGAASMGGLIRYVTAAPDLENYFGQISLSGSTVAGQAGGGTRGSVNMPLVDDKLALRASAFYRIDPGYIGNPQTGQSNDNMTRTEGGRASLLWQITPDVTYEVAGTLQHMTTGGSSGEDFNFDRTTPYGPYQQTELPGTATSYENFELFNANLNADLGFAKFTSVTAYSSTIFNAPQDVTHVFGRYLPYFFPTSAIPSLGLGIYNYYKTAKSSQEFRLASEGDNRLDWMVGAFYTNEYDNNLQRIYTAYAATGQEFGFPALYTTWTPGRYQEYSTFGSLTYHVTPQFDVEVGGRLSREFQYGVNSYNGILEGGEVYSNDESTTNVGTWSITPRYHISDDMMVYAKVATGFRPGGPNSAPGESPMYGNDRTTNYEIGYKTELLDHKLSIDAAIYDIEWSQIQLEAASPTGFSFIQNGGKARSRGGELSVTAKPLQGMTVNANVGYTDATLSQDAIGASLYGLKGERLPYSARATGALSIDQHFMIVDGYDGFVGTTVSYVGGRFSDFTSSADIPRFYMPSYETVDVRVGVNHDQWSLSLYGKNLNNSLGLLSGGPLDTIAQTGLYHGGVTMPRSFGINLTRAF